MCVYVCHVACVYVCMYMGGCIEVVYDCARECVCEGGVCVHACVYVVCVCFHSLHFCNRTQNFGS